MGKLSSIGTKINIFNSLLAFFWQRKLWWMIPIFILLILFIAVLVVESTAGIAPFVYTFI